VRADTEIEKLAHAFAHGEIAEEEAIEKAAKIGREDPMPNTANTSAAIRGQPPEKLACRMASGNGYGAWTQCGHQQRERDEPPNAA